MSRTYTAYLDSRPLTAPVSERAARRVAETAAAAYPERTVTVRRGKHGMIVAMWNAPVPEGDGTWRF
jgi:hypothetical protein